MAVLGVLFYIIHSIYRVSPVIVSRMYPLWTYQYTEDSFLENESREINILSFSSAEIIRRRKIK